MPGTQAHVVAKICTAPTCLAGAGWCCAHLLWTVYPSVATTAAVNVVCSGWQERGGGPSCSSCVARCLQASCAKAEPLAGISWCRFARAQHQGTALRRWRVVTTPKAAGLLGRGKAVREKSGSRNTTQALSTVLLFCRAFVDANNHQSCFRSCTQGGHRATSTPPQQLDRVPPTAARPSSHGSSEPVAAAVVPPHARTRHSLSRSSTKMATAPWQQRHPSNYLPRKSARPSQGPRRRRQRASPEGTTLEVTR